MKKFKKIIGMTLIALPVITIFGYMINLEGWFVFLKVICIGVIIVIPIIYGAYLITDD